MADPIWADEHSRAMEVLGGVQPRFTRTVDDRLRIKFTLEEWKRLFNVADDYQPCSSEWSPYKNDKDLEIFFVRQITEGKK